MHLKKAALNYQKALGVKITTVKPVGKNALNIPVYPRRPVNPPVVDLVVAMEEAEPLQVEVTSFSTNTMRTN